MKDLLKVEILKENITVYDLHESISQSELNKYGVVYFCGGDTKYLLKRMKMVFQSNCSNILMKKKEKCCII